VAEPTGDQERGGRHVVALEDRVGVLVQALGAVVEGEVQRARRRRATVQIADQLISREGVVTGRGKGGQLSIELLRRDHVRVDRVRAHVVVGQHDRRRIGRQSQADVLPVGQFGRAHRHIRRRVLDAEQRPAPQQLGREQERGRRDEQREQAQRGPEQPPK
jgi:hypothetical protein